MLEEGCCGFDLRGIFAIDQHVKQELTNSLEVQIRKKKKKTVIIGQFVVQTDDNSLTYGNFVIIMVKNLSKACNSRNPSKTHLNPTFQK